MNILAIDKRAISFILLIIIVLVCSCSSVEKDSAPSRKILRLGVNNFLFWRSHDEGKFSGAAVDIWREIARRCSLEIKYVHIQNLDHLHTAMENDSIDVFGDILRTAEREEYMIFIEPPIRTKLKYITYVRSGSDLVIDRYEDMYGKKIVVVGGGNDLINNDSNIEKEKILWNADEGFDKLLKGEVDVVHINEWLAIWYFVNEESNDQFELSNYTYSEYHPGYMVMSKKSSLATEWLDEIGNTIQQMIDDGTMKEIINSYVPNWYE